MKLLNTVQARFNRLYLNQEDYSDFGLANAVKKPHHWITSALTASISLALFGALGWAAFSKVDEVAVAPGTLIPAAEVQPVRASIGGEVQEIKVKEGERVNAGDELVRVNSKMNEAEYSSLQGKRPANTIGNQAVAARLQEHEANIARQLSVIAENQALVTGMRQNLNHAVDKQKRLDTLCVEGALPRLDCLDARDRVATLQAEISAKHQQVNQAKQELYRLEADRKSEILALTYQGTIESPVNGTVYNIKVDESGVAVQAGDEVLSILPDGQELILKAKLLNQDKGFVHPGMKVKVKLTTFPYQEFGTLDGTVEEISPNAVEDQKLGQVFPVHIKLHQHSVHVQAEDKPLTPGMDARAELITRRRTILSYLFDPIILNWDDAFSAR